MKIGGPNHTNFNPYKQQLEKQANVKKSNQRSDKLQISEEALKLHGKEPNDKRAAKVQEIKQQVAAGEYKIDIEKTSQKMLDFWGR